MAPAATAEALAPTGMTLEAWADMDEDEPGELVDGELVEEEMPTHAHERVVAWLLLVLGIWAKPRQVLVFGSEHKLGVAQQRGRKPDVSMYLSGARLAANASMSKKPPHGVIEVVSPRPRDVHRDRIDKLGDYARFGVRFYWLIDPQTRLLEILEREDSGRYAIAVSASEGRIAVPGCEDLVLDLDDLWAELACLVADEDDSAEEAGATGASEG